jgi:hypothetical protein
MLIDRAALRVQRFGRVALVAGLILGLAGPAAALNMFSETFDNAESHGPGGFAVGIPVPPESDSDGWNAALFEGDVYVDPSTLVGTQKLGANGNDTPVGATMDDAGLVFEVSTLGVGVATLSFDWRTVGMASPDGTRIGYLVAPSPFSGPNDTADFRTGAYAWSNWTELVFGKDNNWHSESFALPAGEENILVAFWSDVDGGGAGNKSKFDNVLVTPEPGTALLFGMGLGALALRRRS